MPTLSSRLSRLKGELDHTRELLKSPRVSGETRAVLEALVKDLTRQIAAEESKARQDRS